MKKYCRVYSFFFLFFSYFIFLFADVQKLAISENTVKVASLCYSKQANGHGLPESTTHIHPMLPPYTMVQRPFSSTTRRFFRMNRRLFDSQTDEIERNKQAAHQQSLDDFRKMEETIEREYEEREQQDKEIERDRSSENAIDPNQEKLLEVRTRILDSALSFVGAHGWTREAIIKGAESIDYPGVAHGLFPNGGIELIQHFYRKCNEDLIKHLQEEMSDENKNNEIRQTHTPADFAKRAIRKRLEMLIPYLDTWPQALAVMTLPQNVPTSLAQLLTLVDDICYCAGDRSVDVC